MASDDDTRILVLALHATYRTLDALVASCLTYEGIAQVPTHKALMEARSMLPSKYSQSFKNPNFKVRK